MPITFNESQPQHLGDPIQNLPLDKEPPSPVEAQLMDTLFKKNISKMEAVLDKTKDLIVLAVLYVILSLPQVDDLIRNWFPASKSFTILIALKAVILVLTYFVIKNLMLKTD